MDKLLPVRIRANLDKLLGTSQIGQLTRNRANLDKLLGIRVNLPPKGECAPKKVDLANMSFDDCFQISDLS